MGEDTFKTILDYCKYQEEIHPNQVCVEYEDEVMTYGILGKGARTLAGQIAINNIYEKNIVLIFPMGFDYILSFFACLYAGAMPVPCYPSKESLEFEDRFLYIIKNSGAEYVFTHSLEKDTILKLDKVKNHNLNVHWILMDQLEEPTDEYENYVNCTNAFIQYSSGTTSNPKGVIVSHENLVHNLDMINKLLLKSSIRKDEIIAVSWLPLYHDMGLIGGLLVYIVMGHRVHLLPTSTGIQESFLWLKKISDVRATITLAPNSSFGACVSKVGNEQRSQLDLSSLRLVINGAEQVSIQVLNDFYEYFKGCGMKREVMCPCYGLAEATLLVTRGEVFTEPVVQYFKQSGLDEGRVILSASDDEDAVPIVSMGLPIEDMRVRIVDPVTRKERSVDRIGEIWISGPSVTKGYYNDEERSKEIYSLHFAVGDDGEYLATGDLGFFYQSNLYVCARLKELIVVNGKNISPSSLEQYIMEQEFSKDFDKIVFFSAISGGKEDVICFVELKENCSDQGSFMESVATAILRKFQIQLAEVRAVNRGVIKKTESGKIQRNECRKQYQKERVILSLERG